MSSPGEVHVQEVGKRNIYKPSDIKLTLSHATSPRASYAKIAANDTKGSVYCSELKNLMKDIQFLTAKALPWDTVIYIGNTMGRWVETVSRMFPTLQFMVYDGNPTKVQTAIANGTLVEDPTHFMKHPGNVHLRDSWFSVQEAERLTGGGRGSLLDSTKTLMMVETRNMYAEAAQGPAPGPASSVAENSGDKHAADDRTQNNSVYTERDVLKDMADQDAWVHALRPRSALLKFNIPYQGGKSYSFIQGEMFLQPFTQRACTEVRMVVDSPMANGFSQSVSYPRQLYSSQAHDECMFYHNTVTRTEHLRSDARIKVGCYEFDFIFMF